MRINVLGGIWSCMSKFENHNSIFVSYSRVLAMFFVIFVHLCQQSNTFLIKASAQFFICGVTIFIILTGYLYGKKNRGEYHYPVNTGKWIKNRCLKLLPPYYIVVAFILVFDVILLNQSISFSQVFMFLTCMEDFCGDYFYQIHGTGHLWYMTILVISYVTILILFKYADRLKKSWGGGINSFMDVTVPYFPIFSS